MSSDEANGARGGEFHTGLAKRITGREVVLCVDLDGDDSLATLYTGCRTDVLTESTSHALGNTVCTSTGGLLVLSKHVVWEGVNS